MPELPEVEVARVNLSRWATGRTIRDVDAERTRVLRPALPEALRVLVGGRLREIDRRGKALLWRVENAGSGARKRGLLGVYSHLGMTGKWLRRPAGETVRHSRLRLTLDDGLVLHYSDQRMFGRFLVVPGARFEDVPEVASLGPDPLRDGVDVERLGERLRRTRRAVKEALLDQSLLPGVGNIQACESLWRARVDPRRPGSSLEPAQVKRIAHGVQASVKDTLAAFRRQGVLSDRDDITYVEEGGENPFAVYGREGERCPRCRRARIERVVLGGRSTFFCPHCQK